AAVCPRGPSRLRPRTPRDTKGRCLTARPPRASRRARRRRTGSTRRDEPACLTAPAPATTLAARPNLEATVAHRIGGPPLGRLEGIGKVSGQARYSGDVTLPGLIWGKALRSPLPHARIRRVDTSRAKALPGVLTVLTAQDLPDILVGRR